MPPKRIHCSAERNGAATDGFTIETFTDCVPLRENAVNWKGAVGPATALCGDRPAHVKIELRSNRLLLPSWIKFARFSPLSRHILFKGAFAADAFGNVSELFKPQSRLGPLGEDRLPQRHPPLWAMTGASGPVTERNAICVRNASAQAPPRFRADAGLPVDDASTRGRL